MIGAELRTFLFRIVFIGGSVPIVVLAPVAALFGKRAIRRYANGWLRYGRWCCRWVAGIRIRAEGAPLAQPALYAAKHQSVLETMDLAIRLNDPAIVMKRELADIPFWGWAARQYGVIVVDREASAGALRRMMGEARAALAEGRSILIFPEGTRVLPGEQPPLQSGFAGLYKVLKLTTVPIALDSGAFWRRNGPMRSGEMIVRFGDPLPAGLPRAEAEARVHAAINALER